MSPPESSELAVEREGEAYSSIQLAENGCGMNGPGNPLLSLLISLYLLELVGATVVSALGWVACAISGVPWIPSAPLWFAGYLVVYNLDRLYADPADRINTPLRTRLRVKLRGYRLVLIAASAVVLVAWPVMTGRWWLSLLSPIAVLLLQFYSRPLPLLGLRLKDLPNLKSLIAPVAIAAIVVLWPILEVGRLPNLEQLVIWLWCFSGLMINGLVFDYRDMEGDRSHGTRTLAVTLGAEGTLFFLALCSSLFVGLSIWLAWNRDVIFWMPICLAIGCALLIWQAHWRIHPTLLSLSADLLLSLPAIVLLAQRC